MQIGCARRYLRERIFATRTLACAFAVAGFATAAQADGVTLDSMKDLVPSVSAAGVTIYGTIDVGYGYQTHGDAYSGANYVGQSYNIFGESRGNIGSWSSLTNNALSQSFVGVKVEEKLYDNWVAIGKLETGFNPMSGEIADACASLVRVGNEIAFGGRTEAFGDGSRCGQAFNGQAYGGVSNSVFGTLTFGRQNALVLDGMAVYDPMSLSYALSLIGWSGTPGAGLGSTEAARWDNSVKYIFQYGPFHAAAMYASGVEGSSIHDGAGAGNLGVTWQGFSIDGYYTRENGVINSQLGLIPGVTTIAPGGVIPIQTVTTNSNSLYYFVTDNEGWDVMAKYTFPIYDCCNICCGGGGGLKDNPEPAAKVTIYGGYQYANQTNPGGSNFNGTTSTDQFGNTLGGYILAIDDLILTSTRTLQTSWAGVKLETGPWVFAGAYYHFSQDDWSARNTFLVYQNPSATNPNPKVTGVRNGGCFVNAYTCAGSVDTASFLADYVFNKNFDVYAGVAWSDIGGGLARSSQSNDAYAEKNNTSVVTGIRLNF
jgi:predicted porin